MRTVVGTLRFALMLTVLPLLVPGRVWAQVLLENPRPLSFQSGIGIISGWACNANRVDIEFDGIFSLQAAYGTSREDTRIENGGLCDDANNGFGLLFNWNLLEDGVHTVRALADGVEFAKTAFLVTTLGQGEFVPGLSRTVQILGFPQAGASTQLRWQEAQQNFVISGGDAGGGGGTTLPRTNLENPQPASFQSGIRVISGWACDAAQVDIEFDGTFTLQAAYGTSRGDTAAICEDDGNNGFGLLFNWNLLGDGLHSVRALADGVEFANVMFTVTTLGLGEFARGLSGSAPVANFPQAGTGMQLQWQESQQNFPLAGALPPGVSVTEQCTTQQGSAGDGTGGMATQTWTNACLLAGNAILGRIQALASGAVTEQQGIATRGQSTGGFFLCGEALGFSQGDQVFGSTNFTLLDGEGNEVCRELLPGEVIDVFVRLEAGSALNFNDPFGIRYAGQSVVSFRPTPPPQCQLTVSPTQLDFGTVAVGDSGDLSFQVANSGAGTLTGDATVGFDSDFFTIVSGGQFSNLGPGQSQTVTVRFSPTEPGTVMGSIGVNSNCGSQAVIVTGTGTAAPQLQVIPTQVDFGEVNVGNSVQGTFTVTNIGGGTLTGDATLNCGECGFTLISGSPFSLEPQESQEVIVQFSPGLGGPQTDTVNVDSNGGTATVRLSGIGVERGPQLSVNPASLDFGTLNVDQSGEMAFTITNTGGGTLTGDATLSCGECDFAIVSGSPFSLGPEESLDVVIQFIPGSEGPKADTVNVTSNGGSATVTLSGTGVIPPQLSVSTSAINFGRVTIDTSAERTFTITNTGGGILMGSATITAGGDVFIITLGGTLNDLRSGERQDVTVQFVPSTATLFTGSVDVNSNGGSASVTLSGEGVFRVD